MGTREVLPNRLRAIYEEKTGILKALVARSGFVTACHKFQFHNWFWHGIMKEHLNGWVCDYDMLSMYFI